MGQVKILGASEGLGKRGRASLRFELASWEAGRVYSMPAGEHM